MGNNPTKKEFKVEPTKSLYSVHIPNWTPFKTVVLPDVTKDQFGSGVKFVTCILKLSKDIGLCLLRH